jgi:catalase
VDDSTHTGPISHSFNEFATGTGEDFLAFLKLFTGFKVAERLLEDAKKKGGDTSRKRKTLRQPKVPSLAFSVLTHPL